MNGRLQHPEHALFNISAGLSLMTFAWVFYLAGRGFEFSDEGYYLHWISNPFAYDWSLTQFGFVYHPLYLLLNGDIAWLRRANVLLTFILSTLFMYVLMFSLERPSRDFSWRSWVLAAGFGASSFALYGFWLVTPSYNSLAFQALLISGTGLLMVGSSARKVDLIGWVLLGLGGWLAFMAKPSTALALSIVCTLYLLAARRLSIRVLVSVLVASIALALSAVLIDGSLFGFFDRLRSGIELAGLLGGGHTLRDILRFDVFDLESHERSVLVAAAILFFLISSMAIAAKSRWRRFGTFLSLLIVVISLAAIFGPWMHPLCGGFFRGFLIWAVVCASLALGFFVLGRGFLSEMPRSEKAASLLFLSMPHVFAFGTNGNYWEIGGFAGLFWLASGLLICGNLVREAGGWSFAVPLALATQVVALFVLQSAMNQPYRQDQSLRLDNREVVVGSKLSRLRVSDRYARYIDEAKNASRSSGFKEGSALIDLTGQSPGLVFVLGGVAPGQPWLLGGYTGSSAYAVAALKRSPCEILSSAWVLVELQGKLSLPAEVLESFGAVLDRGYVLAATWLAAPRAGGLDMEREQSLLRPVKSAQVLEDCRVLRMKEYQ